MLCPKLSLHEKLRCNYYFKKYRNINITHGLWFSNPTEHDDKL